MKRAAVLVGLLFAASAAFLLPAAPASAHAALESTSPAAGAVVNAPPSQVVLTFSESVRKVPGKIQVLAPDNSRADKGEPVFNGRAVTIPVDARKGTGTYLVTYRVISADSHPVSGSFTYSVGAASAPPTGSGTTQQKDDPFLPVALPTARYFGYAGLVLLVGPALVLALLWPRRLPRRDPTILAWFGVGLIVLSTVLELFLQAPYSTGGGYLDGAALRDVLGSPFGTTHLIRLGVLVAGAVLLRPVLAGRGGTADRVLLAILAVVGLATWPLSGHPRASPLPSVSVVVDTIHLASMAVWLGGLVMLVAFLLRQADQRELHAILPVWSRWAALAVSGLFLAGTVQGLIEVGTLSALFGTTYGRLIIAKIALFAAVIGVAAYSRRMVRARTASSQPVRLRRAVGVELGVVAVVLALSATLVQTTPARTASANAGTPANPGYFTANLSSPLGSVQVEVDPAAVGNNSIHLYAYTADNKPQRVQEWKATAALPSAGIEPLPIPVLPFTDNHASGEINIPKAGSWSVRVTVRTTEIDQATVTATVPIR